jgi:phage terminase large subunit
LIFDEIYGRKILTHKFVEMIEEKLGDRQDQLVYCCGDPKKPEVARYMSDYGLNVVNVNKRAQADRAVGHRRLVDLLSIDPDLEHPMLFVADNCEHTIAEWKHLRYREGMRNEYGEAALEGEDHAFDAAKYFVTTRPALEAEPERPDWLYEATQQHRRESVSHRGSRGLSRWQRTGQSPYRSAL